MNQTFTPRYTAGAIYLVLTLMWGAILAALLGGMGTDKLTELFQSGTDSGRFVVITLATYTLFSLVLAILLLGKFSLRSGTLKCMLALAFTLTVVAPFIMATDLFATIVHLIPFCFVCKFYKEYQPATQAVKHLRVIK